MRLMITWLLVLLMASMLAGTAFAECAAMNMPCCSHHRSTTCHEICGTPQANINLATVPSFADQLQTVEAACPVVTVAGPLEAYIQPGFVPSADSVLARIHVLLI